MMNSDQIKHMVNRFLGWKLPATFHPDNGISFDATVPHPACPPVGTNLFDATQAETMVHHMIIGLPAMPQSPAVDLGEQKHLLRAAAAEIESLRRVNEVLTAKVETMELFGQVFHTRPNHGQHAMTEDIVWRMRRQIEEIDGIQVMRAT